jgi:hypothetical protein
MLKQTILKPDIQPNPIPFLGMKNIATQRPLASAMDSKSTLYAVIHFDSSKNFEMLMVDGEVLPLDDLIGAGATGEVLTLHFLVRRRRWYSASGSLPRRRYRQRQFFLEKPSSVAAELNEYLQKKGASPRRVLCIVNPNSGKKIASKIFKEIVEPLLKVANIAIDVQMTKRAKHAVEMGAALPAEKYSAVLFIGGDGTVYEFLNGVMSGGTEKAAKVLASTPFATTSAGTQNALAVIAGTADVHHCVHCLIRGSHKQADALRVTTPDTHTPLYSLCGVLWGIGGDIAEEGEKYRPYLGTFRYAFLKVKRAVVCPRKHTCTLKYVPARDSQTGEVLNWNRLHEKQRCKKSARNSVSSIFKRKSKSSPAVCQQASERSPVSSGRDLQVELQRQQETKQEHCESTTGSGQLAQLGQPLSVAPSCKTSAEKQDESSSPDVNLAEGHAGVAGAVVEEGGGHIDGRDDVFTEGQQQTEDPARDGWVTEKGGYVGIFSIKVQHCPLAYTYTHAHTQHTHTHTHTHTYTHTRA